MFSTRGYLILVFFFYDSHPAYSTACAVELLLVLVIIQFALEAEIFPEHCSASITALLYRLPQPADTALNLEHASKV